MDHYAEKPTQPSINFSHLADKFLLANGTMVAFKNKLDLQSKAANGNRITSHSSQYSDEITNHHGNTSHSSQYSDEGYFTTGTLESEYEIDSKDGIGCMTGGQQLNSGCMTGGQLVDSRCMTDGQQMDSGCMTSSQLVDNMCMTGGQLVDQDLNGYVPTPGFNGSSYRVLHNRPSPVPQVGEEILDNERVPVLQNVEYAVLQEHESKDMDKTLAKTYRPRGRVARPPLLPPCRVCGDRASGFHYGVNTCEACKGFFRRSINKSSEPYTCVGNGRCKLVPGKRTACSACRYHRCLEVGMSKSKIKTGRYTHELRSRNIMEVKKLQQQNSAETASNVCETGGVVMETEVKPEPLPSVEDKDFEKLLQVLVEGQKNLYEFLDDYYNEELMYSRQLAVYERYMKSKNESISSDKHPTLQETPISKTNTPVSPYPTNTPVSPYPTNTPVSPYPTVATVIQYPVHLDIVVKQEPDSNKQEPDSNKQEPDTNNTVEDGSNTGKDISINRAGSHTLLHHTHPSEQKGAKFDNCSSDTKTEVPSQFVSGGGTGDSKSPHEVTSDPVVDRQAVDKCEEKQKAEVLFQVLQDMERGVQGMLSFTRCLPGLEDLPKEDQAAMLKASRFDIWYIGHIRCFNIELLVGACEWQFHGEELAKVWGSDLMELAFRLSRVGQALNLTKEEVAALRAVSLTFPDRCYPLTERDKVEGIHSNMLELFRYVSKKRHKNFNAWFSKVINFLTIMREFGIMFEKTSSCLKLDWSVLHENPYLLEVFLS